MFCFYDSTFLLCYPNCYANCSSHYFVHICIKKLFYFVYLLIMLFWQYWCYQALCIGHWQLSFSMFLYSFLLQKIRSNFLGTSFSISHHVKLRMFRLRLVVAELKKLWRLRKVRNFFLSAAMHFILYRYFCSWKFLRC